MEQDMRYIIADAAINLLTNHRNKKLTVTAIVEECHIARQTFYYYFDDVPSLIEWMLEQGSDRIFNNLMQYDNFEKAFKKIMDTFIGAFSLLDHQAVANYQDELEKIVSRQFLDLFKRMAYAKHPNHPVDSKQLDVIIRYHCCAIAGIIRTWSKEDEANKDFIIDQIYQIIVGKIEIIE